MTYIPGGGGGGGGGGAGGELVFEWNRTDTSQFEGLDAFSDGGGTISLSVVAVSEWGNALRVSGGGTSMCAVRMAVDPIVFPDTRRDLIIEYVQQDIVQGAGGYGGFAFCASKVGGYHGLNHFITGVAEWASRVDAGVRSVAPGTGPDIGAFTGAARFWIRGEKPVGAPPRVASYSQGHNTTSGVHTSNRRTGSNRNLAKAFGSGGALPASWNNETCDRWGLAIQSSGGNPALTSWDILDLRVYLV